MEKAYKRIRALRFAATPPVRQQVRGRSDETDGLGGGRWPPAFWTIAGWDERHPTMETCA